MLYRTIIVGHVSNRSHSYGTFTQLRHLQDLAASLAGDMQFEHLIDDAFEILRNLLVLWNRPPSHSSPPPDEDTFIRVAQDYLDSYCTHLFRARNRRYLTPQNEDIIDLTFGLNQRFIWVEFEVRTVPFDRDPSLPPGIQQLLKLTGTLPLLPSPTLSF